ncbi:hypothetical protein EMCG_02189 [[Emmonsia] crescens]|uniref:Uncharacterized protein n=1 Tax=[Emmonsia] crescens TaxID=73230 RepID=A0A0G2HYW5_9EURO|nr:hypothetical protein EMCG_02189 [Emmonsia crescens UAMH 3008]
MVNPRQELPAWYRRLHALTIKEDRDVTPEDFDEDLSSVSGLSIDSEADVDEEDEIYRVDTVSNRSYNGSDADYYYELKAERKERKLELQETRDRNRQAKDSQRTFDRDKESEVQEMYDSLKNAKPSEIALEQIAGKNFRLYSVDHVDYCYSSDMYPSKYVEFYHLDKNDPSGQLPSARQETQMHGHVYLNSDTDCDFGPFFPPKYAGLEEFRLESTRGKCRLVFQFISNDYVKLKVPREVVFANRDLPAEAPEVFEFAGIRYDREKGKAERKRKRSPSPRETWFEMNHPMGWWNQSRLY